ncbi:helix-turn-helix transcriptional regulator [Amycolatopsis sp. YIM 10]|uniref:helix-turn-helix domain-containing protein n=1 Tax=Amycolatopsis sp. YIM 10 TaxID=2653857 RepID=UPI001D13E769|nr:hypothetical protein [Amycolatopsis sp. YIM 10]
MVHLDSLLAERGMTLTELAARVDVTIANMSIEEWSRQGDPVHDRADAVKTRLSAILTPITAFRSPIPWRSGLRLKLLEVA